MKICISLTYFTEVIFLKVTMKSYSCMFLVIYVTQHIKGTSCRKTQFWVMSWKVEYLKMCCDLVESVRSWQHWLWDMARKRNDFLLLFWESFNCSLLWNHWNTGGVFRLMYSSHEHFNQIENWKCHMFNFRLIALDHITYWSTFWAFTHF